MFLNLILFNKYTCSLEFFKNVNIFLIYYKKNLVLFTRPNTKSTLYNSTKFQKLIHNNFRINVKIML